MGELEKIPDPRVGHLTPTNWLRVTWTHSPSQNGHLSKCQDDRAGTPSISRAAVQADFNEIAVTGKKDLVSIPKNPYPSLE